MGTGRPQKAPASAMEVDHRKKKAAQEGGTIRSVRTSSGAAWRRTGRRGAPRGRWGVWVSLREPGWASAEVGQGRAVQGEGGREASRGRAEGGSVWSREEAADCVGQSQGGSCGGETSSWWARRPPGPRRVPAPGLVLTLGARPRERQPGLRTLQVPGHVRSATGWAHAPARPRGRCVESVVGVCQTDCPGSNLSFFFFFYKKLLNLLR